MQTLFIDFDGTICTDRFWRSLPESDYINVHKLLFSEENNMVQDWMQGVYTSEEINQYVSDTLNLEYQKLWSLFVDDCKQMHVPENLLQTMSALRKKFHVVVITGNMDCFSRFTSPALELERYVDKIVNSYEEKQLKTSNNGESFINHCRGNIKDAILVEDSPQTVAVFRELGATAHQVTSLDNTLQILKTIYESTNRN